MLYGYRWVIEPEVFDNETSLVEFFTDEKISACGATVVKFGSSYQDSFKNYSSNCRYIVHGSSQLCKFINENFKDAVVYFDQPKFECSYYYPKFGDELLNEQYVLLPFGDLNRLKRKIFHDYGVGGEVFVKPNGFKNFTGRVFYEDWEEDLKLLKFKLNPEELVVVSTPHVIKEEWRLLVVSQRVVTGSQYKPIRSGDVPAEVLEYGQRVVDQANFKPHPAWVLDICRRGDDELKVLEVGPFSCCGLYDCDAKIVVKEIEGVLEAAEGK